MTFLDKIKALLKGRKNGIEGGVDKTGEVAGTAAPDKHNDKTDMTTDKTDMADMTTDKTDMADMTTDMTDKTDMTTEKTEAAIDKLPD